MDRSVLNNLRDIFAAAVGEANALAGEEYARAAAEVAGLTIRGTLPRYLIKSVEVIINNVGEVPCRSNAEPFRVLIISNALEK